MKREKGRERGGGEGINVQDNQGLPLDREGAEVAQRQIGVHKGKRGSPVLGRGV